MMKITVLINEYHLSLPDHKYILIVYLYRQYDEIENSFHSLVLSLVGLGF